LSLATGGVVAHFQIALNRVRADPCRSAGPRDVSHGDGRPVRRHRGRNPRGV